MKLQNIKVFKWAADKSHDLIWWTLYTIGMIGLTDYERGAKGKTVSEKVSEPVSESGLRPAPHRDSSTHSPTHRLTHSRPSPPPL